MFLEKDFVFLEDEIVYISLPGQEGLFPAVVLLSFQSPYDPGPYYVLRVDRDAVTSEGRGWEHYEVRNPYQITRNKEGPLPLSDVLKKAPTELAHRGRIERAYTNFATYDPASPGLPDDEDDDFDWEDVGEDDYDDDAQN